MSALRLVMALSLAVAPCAGQQQPQEQSGDGDLDEPPARLFQGSRSSGDWVKLPSGSRVAVGEGMEWRGVRVHLSLLWDVVAVSVETGEAMWAADVGAFWNYMTFREVDTGEGEKVWAVELRPDATEPPEHLKLLELKTGKELDVPGMGAEKLGEPFEPRVVHGDRSNLSKAFFLVASTAENWRAARQRLLAGIESAPELGEVDFDREVVLVYSLGDATNCSGVDAVEAFEDDDRVLLRTRPLYFQTIGGGHTGRPWGVFVLPRRESKTLIVERDAQNLIRGPAIWKEQFRLEKLDPTGELDSLPGE